MGRVRLPRALLVALVVLGWLADKVGHLGDWRALVGVLVGAVAAALAFLGKQPWHLAALMGIQAGVGTGLILVLGAHVREATVRRRAAVRGVHIAANYSAFAREWATRSNAVVIPEIQVSNRSTWNVELEFVVHVKKYGKEAWFDASLGPTMSMPDVLDEPVLRLSPQEAEEFSVAVPMPKKEMTDGVDDLGPVTLIVRNRVQDESVSIDIPDKAMLRVWSH